MKSNIFIRNVKTLSIILGQILFFVFFVWYFANFSFLRPRCGINKEYILAFVLVFAMVINYWIFYPQFYKKHSFWLYAAVTFGEAILTTLLEYYMTIDSLLMQIPQDLPHSELIYIKVSFIFNILGRDLSLLGIIGLVANNFGQKFRLLEKDCLLLKKDNRIIAKRKNEEHIIDIRSVCYLQQRQNETFIYTNDGLHYTKRGSMVFFEKNMTQHRCVRISKNTIVYLSYIQSYTSKDVTIQLGGADKNVTLTFGRYLAPNAINTIQQYLQDNRKTDNTLQPEVHELKSFDNPKVLDSDEKDTTESEKNIEVLQLMKKKTNGQKYIVILNCIAEHPECNIHNIVSETKIPKSTVTRLLAELKKDGLIIYEGARKTGGYRVVDDQLNESLGKCVHTNTSQTSLT